MRITLTVKSGDGTLIAYERRGHGPPLVMVHGATVDHTRWGGVVGALAERFTLFMMDRRGRGASGDTAPYAIEREFEDVAAVVEAAGAPARVLAHSYGAICSLEAALLTSRIAGLLLYEPPLSLPGQDVIFSQELGRRLDGLLAAGDRSGVVEVFLREVIRMTPGEIARMRRTTTWGVCVRVAHTIPREIVAAGSYRFAAERFASLGVPALFLVGSRSPDYLHAATRMASAALSGSRVQILRGQGHVALSTGPRIFLERALPFLEAT